VGLVDCRMSFPEAELVIVDETLEFFFIPNTLNVCSPFKFPT
jgi:hypothetical protein